MARIDRLGEDGKRTVQLASVIGRQFLQRLLERVAGLTGKLEGLLRELKSLEIIYEQGLLPEPAYIFKHAVIQDVAYNSLLIQRRKALHKAVAQAIEELYPDRLTDHSEELAHHYERGEVWEKALEYLVKAGQQAQKSYANKEALDYYDRALAVCQRLGQAVEAKTLLALYMGQGAVHFVRGAFPLSAQAYQQAVEVARQCGDQRQEAEALRQMSLSLLWAHEFEQALAHAEQAKELASAIGALDILAGSLFILGNVPYVTGKLDVAARYFTESLRISREAGDTSQEALNLFFLTQFHSHRGQYPQALQIDREGIALSRANNLQVFVAGMTWFNSLSLCGKGEYHQAFSALREALQLSERLDAISFRCRILNSFGWIYGELYNLERAIRYNQEGLELSLPIGDPEIIRNAEINLGDDYLLLGDLERARAYLEKVYRDSQQRGKWGEEYMKWRYMQHCCHSLGELWIAKGDAEKALQFAEECLALAEPTESRKNIVKGWRLRGQAFGAQGKFTEAETELHKALALAKEIGNPPQLWKTYQALGELWEQQGLLDHARSAYTDALAVIDDVASQLQDQEVQQTFLAAGPVQALRGKVVGS
jgi:tetratricopeptide (TPR) repeat protein